MRASPKYKLCLVLLWRICVFYYNIIRNTEIPEWWNWLKISPKQSTSSNFLWGRENSFNLFGNVSNVSNVYLVPFTNKAFVWRETFLNSSKDLGWFTNWIKNVASFFVILMADLLRHKNIILSFDVFIPVKSSWHIIW